jgi:hypothetical protein
MHVRSKVLKTSRGPKTARSLALPIELIGSPLETCDMHLSEGSED